MWTVPYYDKLQNTVGGGKPKMKWHFTNTCGGTWPTCTKRDGRCSQQHEPATGRDEHASAHSRLPRAERELATVGRSRAVARTPRPTMSAR